MSARGVAGARSGSVAHYLIPGSDGSVKDPNAVIMQHEMTPALASPTAARAGHPPAPPMIWAQGGIVGGMGGVGETRRTELHVFIPSEVKSGISFRRRFLRRSREEEEAPPRKQEGGKLKEILPAR